jgi:carbohydrate kinase (thermoresistant glucokinase family)
MKNGVALSDADHLPWLFSMRAAIEEWQGDERGHVLACSALKESYRKILASTDSEVVFVYLTGGFDLIKQRLSERKAIFLILTYCAASLRHWRNLNTPSSWISHSVRETSLA